VALNRRRPWLSREMEVSFSLIVGGLNSLEDVGKVGLKNLPLKNTFSNR
jgi:hypothetical protein